MRHIQLKLIDRNLIIGMDPVLRIHPGYDLKLILLEDMSTAFIMILLGAARNARCCIHYIVAYIHFLHRLRHVRTTVRISLVSCIEVRLWRWRLLKSLCTAYFWMMGYLFVLWTDLNSCRAGNDYIYISSASDKKGDGGTDPNVFSTTWNGSEYGVY